MSFLDENGLSYFYGKLKETFIRTVNSQGPDANGNVAITNVATADNLTSPDAQASYSEFIYRTSGGSASLSSGEAQLVYIDGNVNIQGRVAENFDINATNGILVTYSASIWREQIYTSGTYVFSYARPTSSIATSSWTPTIGNWSYNGTTVSLASFGLYAQNVFAPSIMASVSSTGASAPQIVPNTWMNQVSQSDTYNFIYSGNSWTYNNVSTDLTAYGITFSGTPVEGDTIIVNYQAGTADSTITVVYTAPEQGTIIVATPTAFSATGFNQFDKNSMFIQNASISNGMVVSNTGTYLCYCRAKGGVDNGYVAYSASGRIRNIGWCANLPAIGEAVITTDQSVSTTLASIPFNDDGYVVVVVTSMNDLCVHPKWSGSADNEYSDYVAPSVITLPLVDTEGNTIPIGSYGMPAVGGVSDRLNLDAGTYIKKIERLENTTTNMNYVINLGVVYDYDSNYIYYVLDNPITYIVDINPVYIVNDWGTEEFIGTTVNLKAQTLYGQNLRDKLRTDVVTISAQNLTPAQQNQVRTNINAVSKNGDTVNGGLVLAPSSTTQSALTLKNTQNAISDSPTSTSMKYIRFIDKNEYLMQYIRSEITATESGLYIIARNAAGDGNQLGIYQGKDGSRRISLNSTAWRTALGLGTNGNLPITVAQGGTGATGAAAARSNLQAAHLIIPANLTEYGLSVSGTKYNFTLAELFAAVPGYSRVSIPWIKSQDTSAFGTLAGELPTGTTDYGMLTLEKAASLGEFRFVRYSSSNAFHGSFTTINSRGFNGWVEDKA